MHGQRQATPASQTSAMIILIAACLDCNTVFNGESSLTTTQYYYQQQSWQALSPKASSVRVRPCSAQKAGQGIESYPKPLGPDDAHLISLCNRFQGSLAASPLVRIMRN